MRDPFLISLVRDKDKKAENLLSQLDDKLNEFISLDRTLKDYSFHKQSLLKHMTGLYWSIIKEIIRGKFPQDKKTLPDNMFFSADERLFIDFGFISDRLCSRPSWNADMPQGILTLQTMSEWIEENFCCFFDKNCEFVHKRINFARLSYKKKFMETSSKLKIMVPFLFSSCSSENGTCSSEISESEKKCIMTKTESEDLINEWVDCVENYSYVFAKTSEWKTEDEDAKHVVYLKTKRFIELNEKIDMFIKQLERSPEHRDLTRQIRIMLMECFNTVIFDAYLSKEGHKAKQKRERIAKKYHDDFTGAKVAFLDCLNQKSEYASLMAKQSRMEYNAIMDEDGYAGLFDMKSLEQILLDVLYADIGMFDVSRVRMYGTPRILLIPGKGLGTYDWSDHTMLLPVSPIGGDLMKSAAFACASFRWDADEERILKDSYSVLPENKKKNLMDLNSAFAKDYHIWSSKETKGFRVMPKNHFTWFSGHFKKDTNILK